MAELPAGSFGAAKIEIKGTRGWVKKSTGLVVGSKKKMREKQRMENAEMVERSFSGDKR